MVKSDIFLCLRVDGPITGAGMGWCAYEWQLTV